MANDEELNQVQYTLKEMVLTLDKTYILHPVKEVFIYCSSTYSDLFHISFILNEIWMHEILIKIHVTLIADI